MNSHHNSVAPTVWLGSLNCRTSRPAQSFWQSPSENHSRYSKLRSVQNRVSWSVIADTRAPVFRDGVFANETMATALCGWAQSVAP